MAFFGQVEPRVSLCVWCSLSLTCKSHSRTGNSRARRAGARSAQSSTVYMYSWNRRPGWTRRADKLQLDVDNLLHPRRSIAAAGEQVLARRRPQTIHT